MGPEAPAAIPNPLPALESFAKSIVHNVQSAKYDLQRSAIARVLAVVVLHPLDATKARLQFTTASSPLAVKAASRGPLFAGISAAVVAHAPYGIVTFGLFAALQPRISRMFPKAEARVITVLSAVAADAVGALWIAPMETIKLRMMTGMRPGIRHALDGGGFFKGLSSQIMRDVPVRALQLVCYEGLRNKVSDVLGREVHGKEGVVVGAIVGASVGAVTTPLDVLRTRVMAQRANPGSAYMGWLSCAKRSIGGEGGAALFRGLVPRMVYMGASVALFSVAYEICRKYVDDKHLAKCTNNSLGHKHHHFARLSVRSTVS